MTPTERLYWADPYRTRFSATLVEAAAHEGRPTAVLSATCFYPTSGGQPHDTGTLGGVPVVDVLEEDGRIVHVLGAPLAAAPGDKVSGEIDWERRFDHMQQHSGQHLLSAACQAALGAATVSFHLGAEACTVDLDSPDLSADDLARAAEAANAIVYADRPVHAREYSDEEVAALPLRKAPAVTGRIRVVSVEGYDASACGGTHVAFTGEVGPIHVRRIERRRGQTRVEFLCGRRAQRDLYWRDALLQSVAAALSVGVADLPAAVARLQDDQRAAQKALEAARQELLTYRVAELAAGAETLPNGWRVVCRVLEGFDAAAMRVAANTLIAAAGTVALLGVADPAPQVLLARSADVDVPMGTLLREVLAAHGGRGGGAPHLAQGGGVAADDLPAILAEARRRVAG